MNIFNDKKNSRPRRKDAGQALVELAIVLPVLLLLVCGIIEFGRAMYIKNTLTSAARAAVRVAVVTSNYNDHQYDAPKLASYISNDKAQNTLVDCLSYVDKSKAFATIDVVGKSGTGVAMPNDTVTATVSIPFNTIAAGLLKMLRPNNEAIILVGMASMRYE